MAEGDTRSSAEVARLAARSIAVGSKSFAAAAKLFDPATRESVVMLYAWCRYCDDVVDGQEAGFAGAVRDPRTPAARLAALRRDTALAARGQTAGLHPSFAALAQVVRRHRLPEALLDAHLAGFALDTEGRRFEMLSDLLVYCWHVAGAVGVMMARIMGVDDEDTLDRASDLGIAFQLTNIARDVVDDAKAGRVYVPLAWLREEGIGPGDLVDPRHAAPIARLRARLVSEAEGYYASARIGIDALPRRSAWAVGTAFGIYRMIGLKLVRRGEADFDRRVSTDRDEKFGQVLKGAGMALWRGRGGSGPRTGLWTRPRGAETAAAQARTDI